MRGNPQTLCSASRYDNGTAHLMTAHLVTSLYRRVCHWNHPSWREREASERSLILGLSNLVETCFLLWFFMPVVIPVGALDSILHRTAAGVPVFLRPPKQY